MLPEVGGIDPSFFFDDDGRAYILNNDGMDGKELYEGHRSIRIREFDVENDCTIGPWKMIVNGGVNLAEKPIWIEGPHMYKINGYYYLIAAEGGTSVDHSEVIFRGDHPMGEFIPWDKNPILTQRHLPENRPYPITCAGHADLLQTKEGDWWAVFLACRPIGNKFENLGRETFLMPVKWTADGFPYMTQGEDIIPMICEREGVIREEIVTFGNFDWYDDFEENLLKQEWLTLRAPATDLYSLTTNPGFLTMKCSETKVTSKNTPAYIGRRIQHHQFDCETSMYMNPESDKDAAGILIFKDEKHHLFMAMQTTDGMPHLILKQVNNEMENELAKKKITLENGQPVRLKVVSSGEHFSFYYALNDGNWMLLCENVDAGILSTAHAGGFTGTTIGLYATK